MKHMELPTRQKNMEMWRLTLAGEELSLRKKYRNTPAGFADEEACRKADAAWQKRMEEELRRQAWYLESVYPPEQTCFVGREEELKKISTAFESGGSPVILFGMGGIGKTALATEYIRRVRDLYDQILYLPYHQKLRTLIEDDRQVHINGMHYDSTIYGGRLKYFRIKWEILKQLTKERKTLILLDNCSDPDDDSDPKLQELLGFPCDILVTTRHKPQSHSGTAIAVEAVRDHETLRLLTAAYRPEALCEQAELADILAFAEQVDYLTLPVVMKIRRPKVYNRNMHSYREFAYDLLESCHLKRSELSLLLTLAIMPVEGMPLYLYREWSDITEEMLERFRNSLLLTEYEGEEGIRYVQMHPVIAEAVINVLPPNGENCRQLLKNLLDYVQGSSTKITGNGKDGRNTWSRTKAENQRERPYIFAILHALPNPLPWLAECCDALVTWLWIMDYKEEAESCSLKLYRAVEQFYGRIHQTTAQMALRTAAMYWNTGRKEESYRWYQLGHEIITAASPANYMYLTVRYTAAEKLATNVYAELGDTERTLAYLSEAIALQERPDYPLETARRSVVFAMRQKCECLISLGRLEEAEQEWQKLSEKAPDWLVSRASWRPFLGLRALLLEKQGKIAASIDVSKQMLEGLDQLSIGEKMEMLILREQAADRFLHYASSHQREDLPELALCQYRKIREVLMETYPDEEKWIARLLKKIRACGKEYK